MENKEFWEQTNQNDGMSTAGLEPNVAVKEYEYQFMKDWNILDAGCGEGITPLYLARQGFKNIDAFDISQNAIDKLGKMADTHNLMVHAWVQDLCEFKFHKKYDLIMSHDMLHFVSKNSWRAFIEKAKASTSLNGINVIQIPTNKSLVSHEMRQAAPGLADEEELLKLYRGWKILDFKSYVAETGQSGAPGQLYSSNRIVAQKIWNDYSTANR